MKKWRNMTLTILGVIIGYGLHYYVFSEVITRFVAIDSVVYMPAIVLSLCLCMVWCIVVLLAVFTGEIPKKIFGIAYIGYFLLLFLMLFGRYTAERICILNPLISIMALKKKEMLLQSVLNVACFIPLGYFFKHMKKGKMLMVSVGVSFALEALQFISMRGMFDLFDIALYTVGISIGYFVFNKIKIRLT